MEDFNQILEVSALLAEDHPGHVFIGGLAVYMHATNCNRGVPEASHDSDLMVSLTDFSSMRDDFEVTRNARLGKHQLIWDNVEFDVYVEQQNNLRVPYDEAFMRRVSYGPINVACLEHLLVLKLAAYLDRKGSSKGHKDVRDIVTISQLADDEFENQIVREYLNEKDDKALEAIGRSNAFTTIARGNAHEAKKLRAEYLEFVDSILDLG